MFLGVVEGFDWKSQLDLALRRSSFSLEFWIVGISTAQATSAILTHPICVNVQNLGGLLQHTQQQM